MARSPCPTGRDHPRVGGEQGSPPPAWFARPGPSLQVQGAEVPEEGAYGRRGLRRRCREQRSDAQPITLYAGPSPRARGAAPCHPHRAHSVGNISHAREHVMMPLSATLWMGSSPHARVADGAVPGGDAPHGTIPPRARGAVEPVQQTGEHRGTIPASAGSRRPGRECPCGRRDHPRARGAVPGPAWIASAVDRPRGREEPSRGAPAMTENAFRVLAGAGVGMIIGVPVRWCGRSGACRRDR